MILNYIGYISTIIVVASVVMSVVLWVKGILPVLLRLGNGLAKRRIAIFAKDENLNSLKNLLVQSELFDEENILEITKKEDVGVAECATVYLVFWHDWTMDIESILQQKRDKDALIIYAPRSLGPIPEEQMENLDSKRNTAVTNFRGRLLNDVITAMITTSYN